MTLLSAADCAGTCVTVLGMALPATDNAMTVERQTLTEKAVGLSMLSFAFVLCFSRDRLLRFERTSDMPNSDDRNDRAYLTTTFPQIAS
jgi:hypothetical protein